MTLTLLLDLDDTLLDTHMEQFIPAYFEALARHLAVHVSPDAMRAALTAGTRRMLSSRDPSSTLRQVFDAEFYPRLGVEREELQPAIDRFYDEVFPGLGALTQPRPAAVELVRWALERGFRVAIATDPLFPLKAIRHRLRFAGLPPEQYPFALISSYESFHFTKTHAAYYAEFMGRLGWPDGPVLMVGNDFERDLAPANALQLPTYWVHDASATNGSVESTGAGSLTELRHWLERADLSALEPRFTRRESFIASLSAAPASIASLLEERPIDSWAVRPRPGEWALTEVLCHLRDTDVDVNLPRLQRFLNESLPFITANDTNAWVTRREYLKQDGRRALEDFVPARLRLLENLNSLNAEDWERKARHSIFGPTTLLETVGFMAEHDRLHIQQIWKLIHQTQPTQPA